MTTISSSHQPGGEPVADASGPQIEQNLDVIRRHLAGDLGRARVLAGVPERSLDVTTAATLLRTLSGRYEDEPLTTTPHAGRYLAALLAGAVGELDRALKYPLDPPADRIAHAADLVTRAARLPVQMTEPGAEELGPFAGRWKITSGGETLAVVTAADEDAALKAGLRWAAVRLSERSPDFRIRQLRAGELNSYGLDAIARGELWPDHPDRTWPYAEEN